MLFAYNTALQETMGETPFFLMHGFQLGAIGLKRTDMNMALPDQKVIQAEDLEILKQHTPVKDHAMKAQQRQAWNHNRKHFKDVVKKGALSWWKTNALGDEQ